MQKPEASVDSVTKGAQTLGGAVLIAALFVETGSAGAIIDFFNQTLFDAGDLGTVTNGMAIGLGGFGTYAGVSLAGVQRAKAWLGAVPFVASTGISTVFLSGTVASWVSDPATSLIVFGTSSVVFLGTVHKGTLEKLNNVR
ncbi:hypothetical protein [Halorubrum sp. Atlit-26R]|uniref:hypothetical protein n=1 Tax=Halorubrum sp. Atlit-26R TaxID=2282128 RepID=UPI000EF19360|nr:hypothetical protein [Halorubrum sp. Atlit-26R]RLM60048.1 hypothetical protein DVK07_19865 [Halorubrum sp. Atlit-26R]